jgi:hypothetical protein
VPSEAETTGFAREAWEVISGRVKPLFRYERTHNEPLHGGKDDLRLSSLRPADPPGPAGGVIKRSLGSAAIHANQQGSMLKHSRLCRVASNNLLGVHGSELIAPVAANDVSESLVRVHECCLDLERGLVIHSVAVNDVSNLKPRKVNLSDAPNLILDIVTI